MKKQSLNGAWTLEIPGTAFGRVPAQVPGSVYHDLLCAGKIPDPFYRDNENEALKLMEHDFVYTRSFCADAALLHCGTVLLRCDGLDTLAEILLNGSPVGRADNMHRTWEGPLFFPDPLYPRGLCRKPCRRQLGCHGGLSAAAEGALHVRLGLGSASSGRRHLA